MNIIALPDRTRTTRIGFGCANHFAGPGLPAAHRLVGAALDAGIRHFDTAPAYGSGTSEDALAAALDGCNESVTITTKLGIARPSQATPLAGLRVRQMARRVLSFAPGLRARLGQRMCQVTRHQFHDSCAGGVSARKPGPAAARARRCAAIA